jgi:trans-aconitate 2-methyltransferase
MLAKAAPLSGGGLSFRPGDLAAFSEDGWDVVLSNAALHWVPDHPALLARLSALLAPGGQLAFQVPANDAHPSHALAREVAREPAFAGPLGGQVRESPVLEPEAYARLLFRLGFAEQRVRVEVYAHRLAARDDVVEWVKGTYLTDFQKRLDAATWERFLARYRERLLAVLPDERPFLYTYRRVFVWGAWPA